MVNGDEINASLIDQRDNIELLVLPDTLVHNRVLGIDFSIIISIFTRLSYY